MNIFNRHPRLSFDSIFDNFWTPLNSHESWEGNIFSPRVDVKEKKNKLEMTVELPGVKKEDIQISIDDGILTLSAESHLEDKEEKDGKIIRQERRYGKYQRSFSLGKDIKEEDVKAKFSDGILKLSAPLNKSVDHQPKRIEIA
ncbi:MAG: Hsp20/alpha crystallin family protein [Cellvibrionaceae bacterium]